MKSHLIYLNMSLELYVKVKIITKNFMKLLMFLLVRTYMVIHIKYVTYSHSMTIVFHVEVNM